MEVRQDAFLTECEDYAQEMRKDPSVAEQILALGKNSPVYMYTAILVGRAIMSTLVDATKLPIQTLIEVGGAGIRNCTNGTPGFGGDPVQRR